jgi:hypothetical protein
MQGRLKAFSFHFFLFCIGILQSVAQPVLIKGRVIDYDSRDPLAFVNIRINDGPEGVISDIDGKFTVKTSEPVTKLIFSYIGYEELDYIPENDAKEVVIRLKKTAYELSEILIKPGINPANRIISEVIANRFINDHERLPSFTYTSYEKMFFGPESDSIPQIDSLAADSSYIRAKDFFNKQHLFIMESVVKRSFRFPSDNYNKVIASRVSGLKDPLFVFLISQLQSTTFYKEVLKIVDKDYINPISNGCFSKYYFEIQDTIVEPYPYDTTYIISYRPLMNTNFNGLKGTVYVSTNGFAIRNVIASPARDEGMFSIKIQQLYDFIDSTHWFPVQLNTDLIIKNTAISIDSSSKTQLKMMGRGKSYISEIDLEPDLKRSQFGAIEVDVQPDAYSQTEDVWNRYRIDSLTQRDQRTYRVIDSIGKANNFDRLTRRLDAMMNGKVTFGYVDLYMDNLFKVNHYEGLRLGLKLSTSDKVSRWFKVGGYGAYGFKDKEFKYGAEGKIIFDRFRDFSFTAAFYDDVDEAGADPKFDQSRNLLNPERFRDIMVERMDQTRSYEARLNSRLFKYLTAGAGFSTYKRIPLYSYDYVNASSENITVSTSEFTFTEASITLRYAYGEKYMKNTQTAISLGTNYPIVQFHATHGFNDVLGGQYEYNRFDLKISKSMFTKYIGTTSVTLMAGLIDRDIPYVNLYNARASYRPFTFHSPGSFATMRMDEFTADRYASFFFSHNFGKLLFRSKYFSPEPELVTNLGIGSLSNPENHIKDGIKSYEKGYYESGVVVNKILRLGLTDVGLAWFYRYGPYALPTPKENMAWKIAFQFVL